MLSKFKYRNRKPASSTSQGTSASSSKAAGNSNQALALAPQASHNQAHASTPSNNHTLATIPSSSYSGRATTANNIAKFALSLTASVGEAVPFAGGVLKATAGGLLKILDTFDNELQVARLAWKLQDLEECIEVAEMQGNLGEMSVRVEKLTRGFGITLTRR